MAAEHSCRSIEEPLVNLIQGSCAAARQLSDPQSRFEALKRVHDAVLTLRQQLFYAVNQRAPLHRLPRNVLLRILWDVFQDDPSNYISVCKLWRDGEILDEQDFPWFTSFPEIARAMLEPEDAHRLPVSLDLAFGSFDAFASLFADHASHIRTLYARIQAYSAQDNVALVTLPLLRVLEEPAPIMKVFELHINTPAWRPSVEMFVPDALFSDSAPQLYTLALGGIALRDRPYPALSGIRYLALTQNELDFVRVLEFYPGLEELRAECTKFVVGPHKVSPHKLRLLQLSANRQAAEMVNTNLILTRPLKIWMMYVPDELMLYVLASMPQGTLQRFRYGVRLGLSPNACCVLEYSSGITWILGTATRVPALMLYVELYTANLSDVTLHELLWPIIPRELPPMPRLTRLTLVLDRRSPEGVDTMEMPFVASAGNFYDYSAGVFYDGPCSLRVLSCPALAELCLTTPSNQESLVADVYDVCDFLRRTLRLDGDACPALVLRNVSLHDPALGRGMQLLTASVSDIRYQRSRSPALPYIHQGYARSWSWWIPDIMQ